VEVNRKGGGSITVGRPITQKKTGGGESTYWRHLRIIGEKGHSFNSRGRMGTSKKEEKKSFSLGGARNQVRKGLSE